MSRYLCQNLTCDQNYIQVKQFHNRNYFVCPLLHIGYVKHILINQSRSNIFAVIQRQSQKMGKKYHTFGTVTIQVLHKKWCGSFLCFPIMCLYVLSSVLGCPFQYPYQNRELNIFLMHIINVFCVCIVFY